MNYALFALLITVSLFFGMLILLETCLLYTSRCV